MQESCEKQETEGKGGEGSLGTPLTQGPPLSGVTNISVRRVSCCRGSTARLLVNVRIKIDTVNFVKAQQSLTFGSTCACNLGHKAWPLTATASNGRPEGGFRPERRPIRLQQPVIDPNLAEAKFLRLSLLRYKTCLQLPAGCSC